MVANIGVINPGNAETSAYLSAVAGFAAVVLVVLLFLGRRWCYSAVFNRNCCDEILTVNAACVPLENDQFDALSKTTHYPERIFTFENADSDDELRLQIQKSNDDVACHYEEKNENITIPVAAAPQPLEVDVVETALRETKIDDIASQRAEYIHNLEAQSSFDSDVNAHNDTSLLCGESSSGNQESGSLELSLLFDAPVRSMTVHMLQARALPSRIDGQILQSQVRVVLLPMKKQKYKTKIRYGDNPQYMESFVFHKINPEDVHSLGLRVRVYGCERMRRQRLLGEAILSFAPLNLELENNLCLLLSSRQQHPPIQLPKFVPVRAMTGVLSSPGSASVTVTTPSVAPINGLPGAGEACSLARSDSASSCCSTRTAPELLIGLQYNPSAGHLSVEVIKGTHFRKLSPNKAPDTYLKLYLMSSAMGELGHSKGTIRRAQSNPLYKELFIFQVALFQLTEVYLLVSVWWRRSVKRNEVVGWVKLGLQSSGREEALHWEEICDLHGNQIQRWHVLRDACS